MHTDYYPPPSPLDLADPHNSRRDFAPSCERAWRAMLDMGRLRGHEIKHGPAFQTARERLGDTGLMHLAQEGAEEIEAKALIHDAITVQLEASAGIVGVAKDGSRVLLPWDKDTVARMRTGPSPRERDYSPNLASTLRTESIHTDHPSSRTLRNALLARGTAIMREVTQAPTHHDQLRLQTDFDYFRGQTYKAGLPQMVLNELCRYYEVDDADESVASFLTGQGIMAPRLALMAAFRLYPNAQMICIGAPYFEINKWLSRSQTHLKNVPEVLRVKSALDLPVNDDSRPLIIYAEPISSYPTMQVTDMKAVLEYAASNASEAQPITVISDLTTNAGQYQLLAAAKQALENPYVTVIGAQSLLKYFEYGQDLVQGGVVIAKGAQLKEAHGLRDSLIDVYNFYGLDGDISQAAFFPPVNKDFMQFRAAKIQRNALLIANQVQEKLLDSGIRVTYPGLREEDTTALLDSGFQGGYFFVTLQNPAISERIMEIIKSQNKDVMGAMSAGVSFGFNHTRVERMGSSIRITPGTEDVFLATMQAFNLELIIRECLSTS